MYNFILNLIKRGQANLDKKGKDAEKLKSGVLRAGNAGIVAMEESVGACHRKTYLRYKGIEINDIEDSKELMFAGGRANEDLWTLILEAAAEPGLVIRREEEVPVRWSFPISDEPGAEEITVTGRPDIVLFKEGFDANGSPVLEPVIGLELKQVSSLWSARNVGIKFKPGTSHLIQAAHYSWQLGVPFQLWYTSRSNHAAVHDLGFAKVPYPTKETAEPQHKERLLFNKNGFLKDILPFYQGFELGWTDKGQLKYRAIKMNDEGQAGEWVFTLITINGIKEFYRKVARTEIDGLGGRPLAIEANGDKASYSACDYCPLKSVCDSKENEGLQEWVKSVQELSDKLLSNGDVVSPAVSDNTQISKEKNNE